MSEISIETRSRKSGEASVDVLAESMLYGFRADIGGSHDAEDVETKPFPESVDGITLVVSLGGSSDVWAGHFGGETLVVKKARKPTDVDGANAELNRAQLIDEYVADRIYEAMGFPAPTSKIYDNGGYKVAKFIRGKDLNAFSETQPEYTKIKNELRRGFVLDCLLANWDVIGTAGGDNVRLGEDGRVYRLDNGGAMRFRAKGAPKGDAFGDEVGELNSLRKMNKIFSDISDDEISDQIKDILDRQAIIFDALRKAADDTGLSRPDFVELEYRIEKRLYYLKSYLRERGKEKTEITDPGPYESVTTRRYFEDWDKLELAGNPEIKDRMRINIIEAEKIHEGLYDDLAENMGVSVEEFKSRLQAKIEELVGRSEFFRATGVSVLSNVMLGDYRWKSQFETDTSDGTLDPQYRTCQEMAMFGFNILENSGLLLKNTWEGRNKIPTNAIEANKEKRPIYGYFSDEEHGVINDEGKVPPPSTVCYYGRINFKIKKDVAVRKATITFHDSLSPGKECPPTPAIKPHFSSLNLREITDIKLFLSPECSTSKITRFTCSSYTEVQYHGGLSMNDVEAIYISRGNGLNDYDIQKVRQCFAQYKQQHPESMIQLIEF
jgi:hypothetical protein